PPRGDLRGSVPRRRAHASGPLQLGAHGGSDDPPLRARDPRLPVPLALRGRRGEPGHALVMDRAARRAFSALFAPRPTVPPPPSRKTRETSRTHGAWGIHDPQT